MWAQGDYAAVARLLEPYAVRLAGLCNIGPGMNVLDVAAGNGNFALAAAGQGANVTACDLTPRMIEMGRARSEAARQDIEWIEGDAEALPVPDASFDLVASVFGAMFAPQPHLVASELFRVCRRSGLVAMANYAPEGFLGSMSALFASYSNPLPYEVPSPFEWGDSAVVKRRFDTLAREVEIRVGRRRHGVLGTHQRADDCAAHDAPSRALCRLSARRAEADGRDERLT
jgi:ubiquinone/menaquinone biosynthesis C-methylase UbiE